MPGTDVGKFTVGLSPKTSLLLSQNRESLSMRCEACNDPVIVRWEKVGELVESQKPTFVMSGMRVRSCCGEEKAPLELGMNYWGYWSNNIR